MIKRFLNQKIPISYLYLALFLWGIMMLTELVDESYIVLFFLYLFVVTILLGIIEMRKKK